VTGALLVPASALGAIDDLPAQWKSARVVTTNGPVYAIAYYPAPGGDEKNSRIIIGGSFTRVCEPPQIGSLGHCEDVGNIAVLSRPDQIAPERMIAVDGEVHALAITGSTRWREPEDGASRPLVWVGGEFGKANGDTGEVRRNGLVAFALKSRSISKLDPLQRAITPPGNSSLNVWTLAAGPESRTPDGSEQDLYIGGRFKVPPPVCGDPNFHQENLAHFKLHTDRSGKVSGTYNARWAARSPEVVTTLAPVPAGPHTGLLVATSQGVYYGEDAAGSAGLTLLAGTTAVPQHWQARVARSPRTRRLGFGSVQVDETLAMSTGRLSMHVAGTFAVPGLPSDRQAAFGRFDESGKPDSRFHEPTDAVAPIALAGTVETGRGAQARWIFRATGSGRVDQLSVVDAVTGEQEGTLPIPDVAGIAPIRSIVAVPGFGVMVGGQFADGASGRTGLRVFEWPRGSARRRNSNGKRSGKRSAHTGGRRPAGRSRSAGGVEKRPKLLIGAAVNAIAEYPGGVAIAGGIDRVCSPRRSSTEPVRPGDCRPGADVLGLSRDGVSVRWMEEMDAPPQTLAWSSETETLWAGGTFTKVSANFGRAGSMSRRNLVEFSIPYGDRIGQSVATPMNWLGRKWPALGHRESLPGEEGVFSLFYDNRDATMMVGGNFATTSFGPAGRCAAATRRIMRLTPDVRPDPNFTLKVGTQDKRSGVAAIAPFTRAGRPAPAAGYVIGGDFEAFDSFHARGAAQALLVVDDSGAPLAQAPDRTAEVGVINQLDEVHGRDGSTLAVRAIRDFEDESVPPPNNIVHALLDARPFTQAKTNVPGQSSNTDKVAGLDFFEGPLSTKPWKDVTAVEGGPNGVVYIARNNTQGRPTIARYDLYGQRWETIATGDRGEVSTLLLSRDGRYLYAAGDFIGLSEPTAPTDSDLFAVIELEE
jgi:hypothetical protein